MGPKTCLLHKEVYSSSIIAFYYNQLGQCIASSIILNLGSSYK